MGSAPTHPLAKVPNIFQHGCTWCTHARDRLSWRGQDATLACRFRARTSARGPQGVHKVYYTTQGDRGPLALESCKAQCRSQPISSTSPVGRITLQVVDTWVRSCTYTQCASHVSKKASYPTARLGGAVREAYLLAAVRAMLLDLA